MSENKRLFLNICLASWKFTWGGVPFLALFYFGEMLFFKPLGPNKIFFFLLQMFQSIFYGATDANSSMGVSVWSYG